MYARLLKRPLDIGISFISIIIFSWLFLVIGLVYLLIGARPVFFAQARIGKDEKIFTLYKFRTLKDGHTLDDRKFWWGNFLRFTSLDELPQLMHVLRGEMSLIGPRPLPVEYLTLFSAEQRKRHQVRPGITGWAQVNGRNSIAWDKKFELDIDYVNHISFVMDCKIMIRTILLLLSFQKDVSLLEEKFTGSRDA